MARATRVFLRQLAKRWGLDIEDLGDFIRDGILTCHILARDETAQLLPDEERGPVAIPTRHLDGPYRLPTKEAVNVFGAAGPGNRGWGRGTTVIVEEPDRIGSIQNWRAGRDDLFVTLEEVERFQQQHPDLMATGVVAPIATPTATSEQPRPTEARTKAKVIEKFPSPSGLKWTDVTITFISNDVLLVEARGIMRRYAPSDLGLRDRRAVAVDRPTTRWGFLKTLATKGEISWTTTLDLDHEARLRLKAVIKDLRKILCQLMSLEDDPFQPYRRVKAYRPKFRLQDRTFGGA